MITIVGTIQVGVQRSVYFQPSLHSIQPISDLFSSWRLNIAGEKREWARSLIGKYWDDAIVTLDDNEASTYELITAQLQSLKDNDLAYTWIEDVWFVCEKPGRFRSLLDNFIRSQAAVMSVSHLLTVWSEPSFRTPIPSTSDYYECEIDLPGQERVWKDHPAGYYLVSIPSIFKVGFLRRVIEHQKLHLVDSHTPRNLEITPTTGLDFLRKGSFVRMVPRFHVFREVIAGPHCPPRCTPYWQTLKFIEERNKRC